jgi:hypothetical protein
VKPFPETRKQQQCTVLEIRKQLSKIKAVLEKWIRHRHRRDAIGTTPLSRVRASDHRIGAALHIVRC